ncbi:unnamed protein product [Bursaphelenchus okinawaensis]|uniref:Uncharacterized protein n=1 Tax=Bursaphelenchus okinawaensis TaxID=465554 RepID=A0A811K9N8_9BILA|nr:unnamed protein product [Bursaphelenchus okinawaensis]CAG9097563.1 unnamed protein product [Bursaphelenchus okinawaensis]
MKIFVILLSLLGLICCDNLYDVWLTYIKTSDDIRQKNECKDVKDDNNQLLETYRDRVSEPDLDTDCMIDFYKKIFEYQAEYCQHTQAYCDKYKDLLSQFHS